MGTMNKALAREIMLQHEKTFKEQVHDLHKLYGKQKLLMAEKIKCRVQDAFISMPPPSPESGNVTAREINLGQRIKVSEQTVPRCNGMVPKGVAAMQMPSNLPKAITDWSTKVDEIPKSGSGPVRKRKIDLEQPPEDDSDDEAEKSTNSLNLTVSSLSEDLKEFPKVYSNFGALPQQTSISSLRASLSLPSNVSQSSCGALGELKMGNVSQGGSCVKPSPIPPNFVNTGQTCAGLGEKNLSSHYPGSLRIGASPSKNNTTFLPQSDLVERASHETGRQARWIFQSPETNIVDTSVKFAAQQQQSPSLHFAPFEKHSSMSQSAPHISQRNPNNKSSWVEPMSCTMRSKVSFERHSPGTSCGDTLIASAERVGSASNWGLKEPCSQGASLVKVSPRSDHDSGNLADGGRSVTGVSFPPEINKEMSQGPDVSLWSSRSPILQLPRYQSFPPQQIGLTASQTLWMQSSETAQNMYLHVPDQLQTGYQGELLHRNQGPGAGLWNMIGLGHYSSIPQPAQKTPFKKPPRLVLKNDGVGMELKTVPPEEASESDNPMQEKSSTCVRVKAVQNLSESCEIGSRVRKEVGQGDKILKVTAEEKLTLEERTMGSTGGEVKGHSALNGVPPDSMLLTVATSSSDLAFSQGGSASVMLPGVVELNLGALARPSCGETGSAPHASVLLNERVLQECSLQLESTHPNMESDKLVEQSSRNPKTSTVTSEKEILNQMNSGTKDKRAKDMVGFSKGEIDIGSIVDNAEERRQSLRKLSLSEATMICGAIRCQSESFHATQEGLGSKGEKEDAAIVENVQNYSQKFKEDDGSPSEHLADAVLHQESLSESKASFNAESGHVRDQQVIQALSGQSTSTDMPSISRKDRKRSAKDRQAMRRVSKRLSSACKIEAGSPVSDRGCASAASPATFTPDRKSESVLDIINKELEQDSDSDNLAASILLSFAPKLDLSKQDQQPKITATEVSSSTGKANPADQGSKPSQSSEGHVGLQLDKWNSASSLGRRIQNPGSIQSVNWTDRQGRSKFSIRDRHRRDAMNSTEGQSGEGAAITQRFAIKHPPTTTANTLNDEGMPIPRSKELSKLNGVSISQNQAEPSKNLASQHAPTGRRSSRGPIVVARASFESRSGLHHQTQHRVEFNPPPINKDSAREGVCSINKLVENMKSKPCGELSRSQSHPRKQCFETAHRKSQK